MNCVNCLAALAPGAAACDYCGTPVSAQVSGTSSTYRTTITLNSTTRRSTIPGSLVDGVNELNELPLDASNQAINKLTLIYTMDYITFGLFRPIAHITHPKILRENSQRAKNLIKALDKQFSSVSNSISPEDRDTFQSLQDGYTYLKTEKKAAANRYFMYRIILKVLCFFLAYVLLPIMIIMICIQ